MLYIFVYFGLFSLSCVVSTGLFVTLFVKFVSDGQGNIVVQTIINFLLAASNIY